MCRGSKKGRPEALKCNEPGFLNLPKRKWLAVDNQGSKFPFCPGKATWYPQITRTFDDCMVARQTGILPKAGSLKDQDPIFYECFPTFIEKFYWRQYGRIWSDAGEAIKNVLESVAKMLGGKK